ncbi:hypothetical protein [Agrobacterium tumefaciens]|uniref:hypothetical protein n=1 Tax=Agrobacterium tumefaciens TaxID=358 RepID=UPI0015734E1A|nr:hypothetical protein [Agrobacterium tumefaciens]NTA19018.1 hypothetical protein [Agrobacterium tumefaciens]WCK74422.1 hypothetical protein G6L96_026620 [Agrobacterium tumefaciens]
MELSKAERYDKATVTAASGMFGLAYAAYRVSEVRRRLQGPRNRIIEALQVELLRKGYGICRSIEREHELLARFCPAQFSRMARGMSILVYAPNPNPIHARQLLVLLPMVPLEIG